MPLGANHSMSAAFAQARTGRTLYLRRAVSRTCSRGMSVGGLRVAFVKSSDGPGRASRSFSRIIIVDCLLPRLDPPQMPQEDIRFLFFRDKIGKVICAHGVVRPNKLKSVVIRTMAPSSFHRIYFSRAQRCLARRAGSDCTWHALRGWGGVDAREPRTPDFRFHGEREWYPDCDGARGAAGKISASSDSP